MGNFDDALHHINRCIAVRTAIVATNADDLQAKADLGSAHNNAAQALGSLERYADSLTHGSSAAKIFEEMLSVDTANLNAQEDLAIANMRLAITHSKLETHDLAVERIRSSLATFSRLIDRPTIPFDWLVRWAEAGKLAAKMEFNAGHIEEATQVVDRLEAKLKELIEKEQSTEWAEEQLQSLDDLRNVLRPEV